MGGWREMDGADALMPYWLGRYYGFIVPEEKITGDKKWNLSGRLSGRPDKRRRFFFVKEPVRSDTRADIHPVGANSSDGPRPHCGDSGLPPEKPERLRILGYGG